MNEETLIPESLKEVIRERIKESYKDLASPKNAIERDMELIHRAFQSGYEWGYLTAKAEKRVIDKVEVDETLGKMFEEE